MRWNGAPPRYINVAAMFRTRIHEGCGETRDQRDNRAGLLANIGGASAQPRTGCGQERLDSLFPSPWLVTGKAKKPYLLSGHFALGKGEHLR